MSATPLGAIPKLRHLLASFTMVDPTEAAVSFRGRTNRAPSRAI